MVNKLKVACLQIRAREYKDRDKNKENILKMVDKAAKLQPQLMVLPECAYPAYYLSPLIVKRPDEFYQSTLDLIAEIKERAKKYKCYIALGIAEHDLSKKTLYNSALLIDPNGEQIGSVRKSHLWHFESYWFSTSTDDQYPVFETEFGKVGIFICADVWLPEIVRCLSLKGADILIDLINWPTSGFDKKSLADQQVDIEYILPTRALENRVWIIAANKVGMEAKNITNCGKSGIFTPDGKVAKIASSWQEEILVYEIPLKKSIDKSVDNQINLIKDRKPELYSELVQPTNVLPIYSIMKENLHPQTSTPLTGVVQLQIENNLEKYLQKIEFFINILLGKDANIIIFPENEFIFPGKGEEIIHKVKQITKNSIVICAITIVEKVEQSFYKTTFLINSGNILGKYRKTHLEKDEKSILTPGDLGLPVFKTPYGYIGIMIGYEGLLPEISRILTLKGADMIIWPSKFTNDKQINICRTRSVENNIFVACSNSIYSLGSGHSLITSPSGKILTSCLGKTEQASFSPLFFQLSRNKMLSPHNNTILNRQPESYGILVNNILKKGNKIESATNC